MSNASKYPSVEDRQREADRLAGELVPWRCRQCYYLTAVERRYSALRYCCGCIDTLAAAETARKRSARVDDLTRDARFPERHVEAAERIRLAGEPGPWRTTADELFPLIVAGDCVVALCGPRGVGKSQIGVSIGLALIRAHLRTVRFARIADVMRDVRATYSGGDSHEAAIMRELTAPSLLILDEVTHSLGTDFERRLFDDLMDARYAARRATIITSNLSPEAFIERIGPSVASRMSETGKIIDCAGWPDRRIQIGKAGANS